MTPAQRTLLKHIAIEPKGHDDGVYLPTLRALRRFGFIEPCERMYFGPRKERYRITEAGRSAIFTIRAAQVSSTTDPKVLVLEVLGGNTDDITGWGPLDAEAFCKGNGEGEYDITVRVVHRATHAKDNDHG